MRAFLAILLALTLALPVRAASAPGAVLVAPAPLAVGETGAVFVTATPIPAISGRALALTLSPDVAIITACEAGVFVGGWTATPAPCTIETGAVWSVAEVPAGGLYVLRVTIDVRAAGSLTATGTVDGRTLEPVTTIIPYRLFLPLATGATL